MVPVIVNWKTCITQAVSRPKNMFKAMRKKTKRAYPSMLSKIMPGENITFRGAPDLWGYLISFTADMSSLKWQELMFFVCNLLKTAL